MNKHQALAISALNRMKSDDTARARRAFANYSPEAMQQEYGSSGQTCAQILASYESQDDAIEKAILWVKEQSNEVIGATA